VSPESTAITRIAWLLITAMLAPRLAWCDDPASPSACVNALEQLTSLQTDVAVYQQLPGEQRHYLKDSERPAELARLQKIVDSACSTKMSVRAQEQAAADRLHTARSPECAVERDRLKLMLSPNSRDPSDAIRDQRQLVADQCPTVPMSGVWLLQMVWAQPPR
jgi:hypothetical protein